MKKNEDLLNEWRKKLNEYLQKRAITSSNKELKKDFSEQIKEYFEKELLKDWTKEKPLIHTIRV